MKNILVLFDQEWDSPQWAKLSTESGGGYQFFHEGFDLFRFPSNAQLLTFDIFKFVDRLVAKYGRLRLDAIVSSHEQFGALTAGLLAERLGLPAMSTAAVLNAQHKAVARQLIGQHVPAANVPYATFPYAVRDAAEIALPFPFYAKPVKAAYSILARRVDNFPQLYRHLSFRPWEQFIIKRLVRPFNDVVERLATSDINGHWMIAEQIVDGFQVNVDGFVEDGEVHILGVIDAVMYPGTDAFLRWEYPSRLPNEWQANLRQTSCQVVKALGLNHGLFNVELRICSHSGDCKVIEVNPRMATQFSGMYEAVDGINLHALAIRLALGEASGVAALHGSERGGRLGTREGGGGRHKFATSFVYRRFDGKPQPHFPGAAQLRALAAFDPEARLVTFEKRGAELKRESKWLQSYRYACLNLAADSEQALREKYQRASEIVGFPTHP
ncbi:MAG: ATP-grasp domain-containing protein [Aeromicrobium sp.]|nr:ATP-grasp domain-containing protein [Burkholderiales bacterium]